MNNFLPINNKKIGILGAARSGLAAAQLANNLGADVFVSDINNLSDIKIDGVECEFGKHSDRILDSDLVIKSPGIKNDSKIIQKINKVSIPIVSEIEFASWFTNGFIIALTGTNGKTTTVELINSILKDNGIVSFLGGNVGVPFSTNVLTEIHNNNDDNLFHVLEVSSFQLEDIKYFKPNISIILNISPDHIDYHKNFNNYKNSKKKLFSDFANNGIAIINNNISEHNEFIKAANSNNMKVITLGQSSTSVFRYKLLKLKNKNYEVKIFYKNTASTIFSRLIGNYQIDNLLTAICIMIEMGFQRKEIENLSRNIKSPPGRIELIRNIKGAEIYIDYAHTPDALENVLKSLRPYVKNKLYLVFGCGGDRDKGKRKDMGKIAHKFSDINIITDDNPRYEDPKKIRREILKYCPNAIDIADRRIAIINTIKKLVNGDILLIAGKGHESTQEIKGRHLYFDDAKVIKKVLVKD